MSKLIRIVRMTFQEDKVDQFLENFNRNKEKIRHFPGCEHLELWRDLQQSQIFCTYSHWQSEDDLNKYRSSDLFREVWKNTKILFADKPQAFSVQLEDRV